MNKKARLFLGLLAFAVMMGSAFLAYQMLVGLGHEPENLVIMEPAPGEILPNAPVGAPAEESPAENRGEQAPDFTFFDQAGNELRLSDFFGAPIVLNFWATWCPACVVESPHFETLYQELGGEVHVIKVNLLDGQRETRDGVDQFVEEHGYSFPLYFDMTGEAAMVYGIRGIPQTIFIDAEGYIVARIQGAASLENLKAGIDAAWGN